MLETDALCVLDKSAMPSLGGLVGSFDLHPRRSSNLQLSPSPGAAKSLPSRPVLPTIVFIAHAAMHTGAMQTGPPYWGRSYLAGMQASSIGPNSGSVLARWLAPLRVASATLRGGQACFARTRTLGTSPRLLTRSAAQQPRGADPALADEPACRAAGGRDGAAPTPLERRDAR